MRSQCSDIRDLSWCVGLSPYLKTTNISTNQLNFSIMKFKEIIEKQVAAGFSESSLDVDEYAQILSISHRHFDDFTNSNGQQIPAGYSYRLNTESGLLKVSTNEENFNNALNMLKNCKPENYVRFCIITISEGTNRTTNEKFIVTRFTCNYCAEEEDAE